jgi:cilla- and flagella-associated protein
MEKKLTEDMIREKSNVDDISAIVDLNFWAGDLEDVSILNKMPNVETVSMSLNKITSLSHFKNCLNLKELFLRKNRISNLKEIRYLQNLPNLKVLWLWDNPLSNHSHYRLYIIKMLPKLQKLDNAAVSQEERMAAKKLDVTAIDNEESDKTEHDDEFEENCEPK